LIVKRLEAIRVADIRRALNLPLSTPVIGFVGSLVAEKGLLDLFEAVRIVRSVEGHAKAFSPPYQRRIQVVGVTGLNPS
jgi:glycosyltransferase involved in cell wall biosynthesis